MDIVRACAIGLIVLAAVTVLHVVLRWMDRRGWIFYGSEATAPIGTRSAMALMEFETLFNPAVEHVLEYRRHGDMWVQENDLGEGDGDTTSEQPASGS